jgi:hypothetical protein
MKLADAAPGPSGTAPASRPAHPPVPSAFDVQAALRPAAIAIVAGLAILFTLMCLTAREEAGRLLKAAESARQLALQCRRLQQGFDVEVERIAGTLYQLETSEALSARRKLWSESIARCLGAVPQDIRLTSLTLSHEPSGAASQAGSLVFGRDFASWRPPGPVLPIKVEIACELAPGSDPRPELDRIRKAFESLPGTRGFDFLDSTAAEPGSERRSSVGFTVILQPPEEQP